MPCIHANNMLKCTLKYCTVHFEPHNCNIQYIKQVGYYAPVQLHYHLTKWILHYNHTYIKQIKSIPQTNALTYLLSKLQSLHHLGLKGLTDNKINMNNDTLFHNLIAILWNTMSLPVASAVHDFTKRYSSQLDVHADSSQAGVNNLCKIIAISHCYSLP